MGVVLEQVVEAAQAAEVAAACSSAVVEGNGVIQVAAPGGLPATRGPAGQVPGGDVFLQPRRGPVGGAGRAVGAASGGRIGRQCGAGTISSPGRGLQGQGEDLAWRFRACS